jgi:hypothetical protein
MPDCKIRRIRDFCQVRHDGIFTQHINWLYAIWTAYFYSQYSKNRKGFHYVPIIIHGLHIALR